VKYVGALRCARAAIPYLKEQRWGASSTSAGPRRNAGNLSGGARNTSLVHLTKTLAVQVGRFGITVNCVHPASRAPSARRDSWPPGQGAEHPVDEVEGRDFAPDSPRGNAICRMVDAAEIAYFTVFLASDKAWAVSGELVVATGGAGRSVYY
jgi:NAD(P)-dependent dehydrogenase (short-subunit alcohol dehydrogenase family)